MSGFKLCRICLNQNVKMYKLSQYHLSSYYEDIMHTKVYDDDEYMWFCFECAMMLQKFHKFKQKCYQGQNALIQLVSAGHLNPAVYQLIRKNNNLESNYQLISISNNDRVKSYVFEHTESKISLIKPDFMKININNIQEQKELCMAAEPTVVLERVKIENQYPIIVFETMYEEEPNESIHTDEEKHSIDNEINDDNKGMIAQQSDNEKGFVTKIENNIIIEIKKNDNDSTEKITDCTEKIIDSTENITDSTEKITDSTEKITDSTEKITDSTEKIKFQGSVKKRFLDSNNWKKILMKENDMEREFKMKTTNEKYLLADIKCTLCYRLFSRTDMLNRHMKLRHCKSIGAFECRYCRMRFKRKCKLTKHLKQHYTRYKCLRCELSFHSETSAFAHDKYHNGVQQTCPHCGRIFRHSSTYYTHLRTHRSNVVCTVCGETFVSEMGLRMHKSVKHVLANNEPPEAPEAEQNTYCEKCDIKFENLSAYERHLAQSARHTDTVDNSVDGADSAPPFKHPLTAPRIRPRKNTTCSECGKNFSTYVAFAKHHTEEHPQVPLAKPRKKRKPRERALCEICGASILKKSMYNHMNTHMRTEVFKCEICEMTFNYPTSLLKHKVTHTGERPFPCLLCEKRFTQKVSMQLHYRTFHLKEPYPKRNRQKTKGKQVSTA